MWAPGSPAQFPFRQGLRREKDQCLPCSKFSLQPAPRAHTLIVFDGELTPTVEMLVSGWLGIAGWG